MGFYSHCFKKLLSESKLKDNILGLWKNIVWVNWSYPLKMSATVGDSMSLDGKDQTKFENKENGSREEFKDDKLARSDVECFVLDDYFVPKQEELRTDF